ncbi:MAG: hypothetical protein H7312_03095 [Tardiphaga sp.]|jgi:hypothetical protein|nr:hypothetical protein [Tardiphaga sp.]
MIIPVLMGCALLWWIGRGMGWTTRLLVGAIALGLIALVLLVERALR